MLSFTSAPPSSFTPCPPLSFMMRMAERSASDELPWYEPKGMSTTTKARFTARTTLWAWYIIWSRVMGRVVSWPAITFDAESPTSSTSTPAPSRIWAIEKS